MDAEKSSGRLWHEGTVNTNGEHILLTYGEGVADNDLPVALIALGPKLTITVQFLITATGADDRTGHILSELRQELDTHLAGEYPLEVWDEAKYHCVVSPNPSSKIRWNYILDWERPACIGKVELEVSTTGNCPCGKTTQWGYLTTCVVDGVPTRQNDHICPIPNVSLALIHPSP